MTTYNAIPDSLLEPDDPITSDIGFRWRDNPIAMFEGSAGAPRLQFAALDAWFTTLGAVGSMAFLATISGSSGVINAGATFAGSALTYSGFHKSNGLEVSGTGLTGTWRAMGKVVSAGIDNRATLFIRIA